MSSLSTTCVDCHRCIVHGFSLLYIEHIITQTFAYLSIVVELHNDQVGQLSIESKEVIAITSIRHSVNTFLIALFASCATKLNRRSFNTKCQYTRLPWKTVLYVEAIVYDNVPRDGTDTMRKNLSSDWSSCTAYSQTWSLSNAETARSFVVCMPYMRIYLHPCTLSQL